MSQPEADAAMVEAARHVMLVDGWVRNGFPERGRLEKALAALRALVLRQTGAIEALRPFARVAEATDECREGARWIDSRRMISAVGGREITLGQCRARDRGQGGHGMTEQVERCLPPLGTPSGTLCVLHNLGIHAPAIDCEYIWTGKRWRPTDPKASLSIAPDYMAECGWHFARVVS